MNVKRFTGRTSKDALALVRQAFGDDAVVMSTRPCAEGVEVLAMAPESIQQLERVGLPAEPVAAAPVKAQRNVVQPRQAVPARAALQPTLQLPATPPRGGQRLEPVFDSAMAAEPTPVEQDVEQLQMSTLSFQDYVRQRMLKRREAQLAAEATVETEAAPLPPVVSPIAAARARHAAGQAPMREVPVLREELAEPAREALRPSLHQPAPRAADPVLAQPVPAAPVAPGPDQIAMMGELRSMRGLIEQRFGALAFMEKLQRQPRQAQLAQKLLDTGFSPALIKKLVQALPADTDPVHWAGGVLERNLATAEREVALEDAGGIYAIIGATGVGKTTSTAKLAAAFAARHGAAELGLITLDAYRIGAQEQLRTYGRILGVPVHTAHDRASLDDLLELLSGKRMVLIDTAGMAQRDSRTRELLDMLSHRSINRLLVLNASAQGETLEDQIGAYAGGTCRGVVLSKLDEAVKLAPALDSCIRHKLKVLAVANGQRVPEDWHRLSANALVQRALKGGGSQAWKMDDEDVNLVFAGMPAMRAAAAAPVVRA
jgi:flagellar biosynthesis protein FlhF